MEGVSQEVASLVVTLNLVSWYFTIQMISHLMGQLQWLSLKMLRLSLKLMVGKHILVKDGNDLEAIAKAIEEAKAETDKPSIIEVKTIIGYGAEGQGTSAVHGV